MDTETTDWPARVEAGRGRPFRFRLTLGGAEGELRFWVGGGWSVLLGVALTGGFALLGATVAAIASHAGDAGGGALVGAASGAAAAALHLRARRVLFRRSGETWRWTESRLPWPASWRPITSEDPIRMEREPAAAGEGFTLYAGSARILSYLGDPSIGRSVAAAFRAAEVPLRTVIRREGEGS